VERELIGAVDYMRTSVATNEGKIGVVGFSLGANLGLWLSESRPEDVAAVVIFYGTRRGSFKKTKAAFQGHFADHDEWEPLKDVQKMEGEIKSARREITSYLYPGTRHWFFEADRRTAYDSDAAEKAWRRTVRFLHAQLG
jgi:carboxymethylenebutenolidase